VNSKLLKVLVRLALAALLIHALASQSHQVRIQVAQRDSIAYWASGQLLLRRANPYDPATVLELEREQQYQEDRPLVLRTPPWSLFMVLPLGLVNAFWGWLLWIAASLASLIVALRLCLRMQAGPDVPQPDAPKNAVLLVGYLFAPVPACLVAGQMGLVLLLGLVLFLWLEADRPLLAGAALVFPFAKPHLLVLFWIGLLVWVVARKKYAVAAGFLAALAAVTALALAFDPAVFTHYREMLAQAAVGKLFIPAISGVIRLIFFRRMFWVQFVPMGVALVWAAWFGYRNRTHWSWRDHGLALLVVSVLTTPYSWLTDEVVLLPAILQGVVYIYQARRATTWKTRLVLGLFVSLNGLLLLILIFKIPFSTGIYFWSSLLWFGWYVYARGYDTAQESS
jgi:hypothetical protein